MNLILSQYLLKFAGFVVATTSAPVVGKAVLVAETMPFFRRFESAPLIRPVLFKTCVYTVFVFLARLIEAYIHYMIDQGRLTGFFPFMHDQFSWYLHDSSGGEPAVRIWDAHQADSSYINAVELMVDGGLTGAPFGPPILRG
jgi:hypothetical protein